MNPTAKSDSSPQNGVTVQVNALSLGAAPRTKSKNLNVVQEFENLNRKKAASFVVIGQITHNMNCFK